MIMRCGLQWAKNTIGGIARQCTAGREPTIQYELFTSSCVIAGSGTWLRASGEAVPLEANGGLVSGAPGPRRDRFVVGSRSTPPCGLTGGLNKVA